MYRLEYYNSVWISFPGTFTEYDKAMDFLFENHYEIGLKLRVVEVETNKVIKVFIVKLESNDDYYLM
jgi:hypothetical protein